MDARVPGRGTLLTFGAWGAMVAAWVFWERFVIRPSNYYDEVNGVWVTNLGGNFLAAAIAELALAPLGAILVVFGAALLAWKWVKLSPWMRLAIFVGCAAVTATALWLRGLYSLA